MSTRKPPAPPSGFHVAETFGEIVEHRTERRLDPRPLRAWVRSQWVPASFDIGIGAQPSRHRPGPAGRQGVGIVIGPKPGPGAESRRVPVEHVAVPYHAGKEQTHS